MTIPVGPGADDHAATCCPWGELCAAALLMAIPVLILYTWASTSWWRA